MSLGNLSDFMNNLRTQNARMRIRVVFEKLCTVNEDPASGVLWTNSIVCLQSSDKEVGDGKKKPKTYESPPEFFKVLHVFQLRSIFKKDIVGFEHKLFKLIRSYFAHLGFFFELI